MSEPDDDIELVVSDLSGPICRAGIEIEVEIYCGCLRSSSKQAHRTTGKSCNEHVPPTEQVGGCRLSCIFKSKQASLL